MAMYIKNNNQKSPKMENNKGWWGCGETGTVGHSPWERKMVQPLWKTAWWLLKKLNVESPYDLAILLLGYTPRRTETDPCMWMFTAALLAIAKRQKQPKYPSMDEQINKLWYTHNTGKLFSHKKEWSTDTCYNMDESRKHYANERNQAQKVTYHMNSIYMKCPE